MTLLLDRAPSVHYDATRREFIIGGVAAGLLVASGCGSDDDEASPAPATADGNAAFPVTMTHKFGGIVIPTEPKRVVTLGLNDQDPVLALGVAPVASASWFEEQVVYPWSRAAFEATGGPETEILSYSAMGDVVERVASLRCDPTSSSPSSPTSPKRSTGGSHRSLPRWSARSTTRTTARRGRSRPG